MEVTIELIDKLAHLSRLEFDDHEKDDLKNGLQRMITFVEKLQQLDTTGVEPLLFISPQQNIFREDEVSGSIRREKALMNAPVKDEQFFKVPKVIRK